MVLAVCLARYHHQSTAPEPNDCLLDPNDRHLWFRLKLLATAAPLFNLFQSLDQFLSIKNQNLLGCIPLSPYTVHSSLLTFPGPLIIVFAASVSQPSLHFPFSLNIFRVVYSWSLLAAFGTFFFVHQDLACLYNKKRRPYISPLPFSHLSFKTSFHHVESCCNADTLFLYSALSLAVSLSFPPYTKLFCSFIALLVANRSDLRISFPFSIIFWALPTILASELSPSLVWLSFLFVFVVGTLLVSLS